MTNIPKPMKPFRAWAIVDRHGRADPYTFATKREAKQDAEYASMYHENSRRRPFRAVRVTVSC